MEQFPSRRDLSVVVIATGLALAGCQSRPAGAVLAAGAGPAAAGARRVVTRWAVFGIDCSASYDMPDIAKNLFANSLRQEARPGDTLYFRTIVADSYGDSSALLSLRFTAPSGTAARPFDSRSRARMQIRDQRFAQARETAARKLEDFRARDLPQNDRRFTDIYGFLSKASELLARAPAGSDRFVVLATDLEDNRSHRRLSIDLKGVHVIVALFQNRGEPEALQALRRFWRSEFERFGAVSIDFRDPSEGAASGSLLSGQ